MNTLATIICLLISLVCCAGRKSESAPCNIYGNGLVDGLSGLEVDTIATGCLNGTINWSYPRGRLLLIFRLTGNSAGSRVCLQTRSNIGRIIEVPTQQVLTPIGGWYCTSYRAGYYTILEFTPRPRRFLYRATYEYTIEEQ
ncbi:hypothetical protein LOTGIDRAFT_231372 [Lottia gigantea]|uniref:Uncharacterized protein n=1 Tax=Lottia gigantea TaxID=225164 RepID=V4A349_LOTGI|nr:hypothetical protein LOTGIDRAFT_231372 [Lottia gigantea]ESO98288.1 hypothetical protein LOTGIDRAFT_231372 [Lottia gigantea]